MADIQHSIRVAARRSGLSAHVIRIWEKRYSAVKPMRTATNRRVYAESEIERLNCLRLAVGAGHSIGHIAQLPTDQLRGLAGQVGLVDSQAPSNGGQSRSFDHLMRDCLAAIRQLDSLQLEQGLRQGLLSMGVQGLLQNLVGPLAHAVGDQWRLGQITAAHEHFASAAIRAFLGSAARPYPLTNSAPTMVVATPAGQIHELGAVIAAAAAANQGWRVTYLGVCLPAAEIAGAAVQDRARAVALSIVYPEDDPHLSAELISLRRFLPTEVSLVVGGRAAPAYQRALHEIGAVHATQLADFYGFLDGMRSLPRV